MALTNEHVGPMVLAKIKIYVFNRAELLIHLCYEIPCIEYTALIMNRFFSQKCLLNKYFSPNGSLDILLGFKYCSFKSRSLTLWQF